MLDSWDKFCHKDNQIIFFLQIGIGLDIVDDFHGAEVAILLEFFAYLICLFFNLINFDFRTLIHYYCSFAKKL